MSNYDLVLEHTGTKGMRWGVRNAEWYPIAAWKAHLRREGRKTSDKNHSTEGLGDRIKRKHTAKKVAKQRAANLEKARKAKAAAEASRKEKEEIIRTGDVNKALERIDDFTNEELRAIRERNQAKIAIAQAKTDAMLGKLGTISNVTNKVANIASDGTKIYNTIAKISNAFGDTDLPILGEKDKDKDKDKDNNNQNSKKNNDSNNQNNKKKDNSDKENLNNKIDKDIEKTMKDIDRQNKKDAKEAEKTRKAEQKLRWANEEPEHVSGDVEDREENFEKSSKKAAKEAEDIIVDAVWRDVSEATVRKAEEYVQRQLPQMDYPLLELKKR